MCWAYPADAERPYPGFSNIISVSNIADSEYSAFQGTLRATTGALTLGISYTFSHSLDDASDRSSANFANSLDIHSNHASSDFDQRQLLNVSYIYDLPLLKVLHGFLHLTNNGSASDDDDAEPVSTAGNRHRGYADCLASVSSLAADHARRLAALRHHQLPVRHALQCRQCRRLRGGCATG